MKDLNTLIIETCKEIDPNYDVDIELLTIFAQEIITLKTENNISSDYDLVFILKMLLGVFYRFDKDLGTTSYFNVTNFYKNLIKDYFLIYNIYILSNNSIVKTVEKSIKRLIPDFEKLVKIADDCSNIPVMNSTNLDVKFAQYEYKLETVDLRHKSKETEDDLNFLGENGWELIGMTNKKNAQHTLCVFKRVKFL